MIRDSTAIIAGEVFNPEHFIQIKGTLFLLATGFCAEASVALVGGPWETTGDRRKPTLRHDKAQVRNLLSPGLSVAMTGFEPATP